MTRSHLSAWVIVGVTTTLLVSVGTSGASPVTTPVTSSFDSDLDGWTTTSEPIAWAQSGGNPGGYVDFVDPGGGPITFIKSPAKFLGDWSALNGVGAIEFEHRIFSSEGTDFRYYTVTIGDTSQPNCWTWQGSVPSGPTDWLTISIPLKESEWSRGLGYGSWDSMISKVNLLNILIESGFYSIDNDPIDHDGIDNVKLLPEPTTLALLALGGLAAARRQGR